jgi:uncharacterized protein with HEPN domain
MKKTNILLSHILESIHDIQSYIKDLTKEDFLASKEKQDSVNRRLEIIGEAVRNLPDEFKSKHEEISWVEIVGMRNNLIHEYFGVDLPLVWDTIAIDIPKLQAFVEEELKKILEL